MRKEPERVKPMDLGEYVSLLHQTEKRVDVNRWQSGGFHVWPLFRSQVVSMFRNPDSYYKSSPKSESSPPSLKGRLLNRFYSRKFLKEFRRELEEKVKHAKCDVLFYSTAASHTDKVNDKWYNRFIDPYQELLEKKYSVLKLELQKEQAIPKEDRKFTPLYVNHHLFSSHFFYKHKNEDGLRISDSPVFGEIKKATGLDFSPEKTDSAFREVCYYRDLFREIFRHIRPRFVFVKCYYEHDVAGLVLAAKECGITTIDIQHGKQGKVHPMYSHWTVLPVKGYELLPDYFWNWGEESLQNIAYWMNRPDLHVPVVGGNLWLAKWKHEDFHRFSESEKQELASWQQAEKRILVTLQPLDKQNIIPAYLAEAIRNSPPGWKWLLRRHPFQTITATEINDMIGAPAGKTESEFASSIPLYALLKKVDHHVTLWSSTCFEANDFDVPTIIAHELGAKLYAEQIAENVFSYAITAESINELIAKGKPNTKTDYIETDLSFASAAFERIGLHLPESKIRS